MLMRRFNAWFEDRLANALVALGIAEQLLVAIEARTAPVSCRDATPEQVAAIGQFLSEHGLRPRSATILPFPAANDLHTDTSPQPPRPAA